MHAATIIFALAAFLPSAIFAAEHTVQVGPGDSLTFDPNQIEADVGDTINFVFLTKNHTVTQSTFDNPCRPMDGGFNTGFVPGAADRSAVRAFNLTTDKSQPLWFFCQQIGHCQQGMVFAVNPSGDKTFNAFKEAAIATNGTSNSSTIVLNPPRTSSSARGSSSLVGNGTESPALSTVPIPITATITWDQASATSIYTTTYASVPGAPNATPRPTPKEIVFEVGSEAADPEADLFRERESRLPNVTAQVFDRVTFEIQADYEIVITQSEFENGCQPLEGGFVSPKYHLSASANSTRSNSTGGFTSLISSTSSGPSATGAPGSNTTDPTIKARSNGGNTTVTSNNTTTSSASIVPSNSTTRFSIEIKDTNPIWGYALNANGKCTNKTVFAINAIENSLSYDEFLLHAGVGNVGVDVRTLAFLAVLGLLGTVF